jgi:outer membrane protein TolC
MTLLTPVALALVLAQAPQTPPPAPAPQPPPGAAAPAQPAPAPPVDGAPPAAIAGPVITLDEALSAATERNYDLKALRAKLRQVDEISWKAWSRQLPQVTASGSYTRQKEILIPLGSETVTFQPQDQLGAQIEATQTLFSPRLWYGIRGAHASEASAALGVEDTQRAILFGVAQAFYGVASLRQAVGVSERLLEIAQRQEKDARVRYEAGAVAKVALLRAEIDRARAEQDLKRARNDFASAKVALATLLDRGTDFDVADPPEPPLATTEPDALVAQALRDRPDVQAARAQVDAARAARNAALGRYLPDVQAFGRRQLSSSAGLTGDKVNWAAGVQLQWTILDGGLRESDVREFDARIDEADASATSTQLRVRQEVSQSLLALDSARANAAKAKEQRDLATENQRLVQVAYRAGTATAVEQADATAALRNAEIGFTTESLSAQLAALRVLQVAGAFHPARR